MPNRKVHNEYAKKIMGNRLSMEDIDDVNRIMDAPSQKYGERTWK